MGHSVGRRYGGAAVAGRSAGGAGLLTADPRHRPVVLAEVAGPSQRGPGPARDGVVLLVSWAMVAVVGGWAWQSVGSLAPPGPDRPVLLLPGVPTVPEGAPASPSRASDADVARYGSGSNRARGLPPDARPEKVPVLPVTAPRRPDRPSAVTSIAIVDVGSGRATGVAPAVATTAAPAPRAGRQPAAPPAAPAGSSPSASESTAAATTSAAAAAVDPTPASGSRVEVSVHEVPAQQLTADQPAGAEPAGTKLFGSGLAGIELFGIEMAGIELAGTEPVTDRNARPAASDRKAGRPAHHGTGRDAGTAAATHAHSDRCRPRNTPAGRLADAALPHRAAGEDASAAAPAPTAAPIPDPPGSGRRGPVREATPPACGRGDAPVHRAGDRDDAAATADVGVPVRRAG